MEETENLEGGGCGEENLPVEAKEEDMEEVKIEKEEPEDEDVPGAASEKKIMTDYGSAEVAMEDEDNYRDLDPEDSMSIDSRCLEMPGRGVELCIVKKLAFLQRLPMEENIWDGIRELMQMQRAVQLGGAEVRTRVVDFLRNRKRYIMHYTTQVVPTGEMMEKSDMPDEWVVAHYRWSEVSGEPF
eukprot:s358_g8.t1